MTNLMLTVLTNGREDVFETVPHALGQLKADFNMRVIVDDSGDDEFRGRLYDAFAQDFLIVATGEENLGFNVAMRKVMSVVADYRPDAFFHLEEDFIIERPVEVPLMVDLLLTRPLLQLALLRQPWFGNEVGAGGVIEAREAQGAVFVSMHDGVNSWTEHRDHMTLNPCLMPGWLAAFGWPRGTWSESRWGRQTFERHPELCAAYWGDRAEGPWVTHVGERTGHDY